MQHRIGVAHRRRGGWSHWPALVFLVAFLIVLLVVCRYYLVPAFSAWQDADPHDRKRLSAYSLLVLIVVLFTLGALLMMTFRVGRFFFPRPRPPRTQTPYVDAWAEAGRRMDEKKVDDEEEE